METVRRTLLPHIKDHAIIGATLLRPTALHPMSMPLNSLYGAVITGARRRGKLLLIDVAHPDANPGRPTLLVAHLRMTGALLSMPAGELAHKHTRCIFDLRDAANAPSRLFFDDIRAFGKLFIATPELLEKWDFWRELGPEPLEMDGKELLERLKGQRPLKTALLDQKVIAGIGNIYADESLFKAGLHPQRPANSLNIEEASKLMAAIQDVLRLSISQCGSSIRDYKDADGNAGAFQNSFSVYGKGGEKCAACGSTLEKIRIGGRATVFCPNCQK